MKLLTPEEFLNENGFTTFEDVMREYTKHFIENAVSDENDYFIEEALKIYNNKDYTIIKSNAFIAGAKWYQQQLKNKLK